MNFKHYIITRLATPRSTVKWLNGRVDLFNKFYLKGLSIQKVKNFSVILLCSDSIKYNFSQFMSNDFDMKIHSYESFKANPSSILSKEDLSLDSIISSRLDSDDLLANHYVENVQKHALINSVIDHKHYYFVDSSLQKFSLESSRAHSMSMFLSTCFIPSEFNEKNCYASSHFNLARSKIFARKVFIPGVGSASICHGSNSNSKWFRKRKRKEINIEDFNIIFS
jgi:hypothetical protein